jgi:hypothetical protein
MQMYDDAEKVRHRVTYRPTHPPTSYLAPSLPEPWRLGVFIGLHGCDHACRSLQAAGKGPDNALKNRLLFHVAHKSNNESKLLMYHQKLSDTTEDQLSLAAIHYLRSHFQEVRCVALRCVPCPSCHNPCLPACCSWALSGLSVCVCRR